MGSRLLLQLLLVMQLAGCAYVATVGKKPVQRVDYWIEQKEYGKALLLLDDIDPSHPDYRQLETRREMLHSIITEYERELLIRVRRHIKKGELIDALTLLEGGVDRLPQSEPLRKELADVQQQKADVQAELRLMLLMRRAEWLVAAVPLQQRLTELDPQDWWAQRTLDQHQEESEEIAGELLAWGQNALQQGRLKESRQALTLAGQLADSAEIRAALATLEKTQQVRSKKVNQARQHARKEERDSRFKQLLSDYQSAWEADDYASCHGLMDELEALDVGGTTIPQMRYDLDRAISARVTRLNDTASSEYSQGQYEQAASHWRDALVLAPDNKQIRNHLERVKRVLQKLHQLREKQRGD